MKSEMSDSFNNITFDRNKRPSIDFDIFTLEDVLQRKNLNHDPRTPHRVQFYVLILVTAGLGKHTIDFKEHTLEKGSLLTIRKNQIHNFHHGNADGFVLVFTEEYVLSYMEQQSSDKISALFNELLYNQHSQLNDDQLKETLSLFSQIEHEFSQPMDDHTSAIIRSLLQVLVRRLHRTREASQNLKLHYKYTPQFMAFQKLVESRCQTFRTVQYYADELNVTTRTLNNITHATAKTSAKKFIDNILILQIKRLLINTPLSIKEIAHKSGFDEPTNLFKFFKRYTGKTPEGFRTEHSIT